VISLRGIKRGNIAPILIIVLSIASLFILGSYAKGCDTLFFACPKIDAAARIEKAAELNLTYEALAESSGIKVYGTNHAYARILGYSMTSGSFFTQTAQDEKRKNAVLNETLAFEAFGSFDITGNIYKINNEPYVVVGVVDDRQDEKNAYIPEAETASAFLSIIETEEKAIADLKSLGINENRFYLVNISEIAGVVRAKPWLAIMTVIVLTLIVLIRVTITQIVRLAKKLKLVVREKYWRELLKTNEIRRFMALAVTTAVEIVIALWMFLKATQIYLQWAKYAGEINEITSLAFGGRVQMLKDLCLYSNIVFCVFLGGMILGVSRIKKHKQSL